MDTTERISVIDRDAILSAEPVPLPAVQLWSGGKDSAMALWKARQVGEVEVKALATTVTTFDRGPNRSTWHKVHAELMRRQAEAIRLPLFPILTDRTAVFADLMESVTAFLRSAAAEPFRAVVWGDLYLDIAGEAHDWVCEAVEKAAIYPLKEAGRDTVVLAYAVLGAGFKSVVTSVDTRVLDPSFVGRPYDAAFLADLPRGVDLCGERGEFHTFVWDGPIFREPVPWKLGRTARWGKHDVFCDLIPA